jgi:hypothetical protein
MLGSATVANDDTLSLSTRLWFAWICFFRVLFDAAFAARAWSARELALPPAPPTPALPAPLEPTPALQLLALLQREGRFIDFLQQDIAAFSDGDVGAAARVVHEGCRKTLRTHATIEPLRAEAEGTRVTLAAGFDAAEVRLVGDVQGEPPYSGALRHRGWRAVRLELPRRLDNHGAHVLAPAEVELG